MTKLKCKKIYGTWFYKKIVPDDCSDLDGTVYELYDSSEKKVGEFGSYGDMKYYVETGENL